MDDPKALRRYRANLQGEVDGAAVYAALAKAEADPKLAEIYRRLAAVERAHGEFWRKQIRAAGGNGREAQAQHAREAARLAGGALWSGLRSSGRYGRRGARYRRL